jgi:hypothetical protein
MRLGTTELALRALQVSKRAKQFEATCHLSHQRRGKFLKYLIRPFYFQRAF